VTDPVKKIEQSVIPGMSGGYVTYKVTTKTSLPSYTNPEAAVRRRFKDFVVCTPFSNDLPLLSQQWFNTSMTVVVHLVVKVCPRLVVGLRFYLIWSSMPVSRLCILQQAMCKQCATRCTWQM
jgi:hypothetical protein